MPHARGRRLAISLAGALALSVVFVSPPASAEVVIDKKVSYFAIGGNTAEELDDELARRGPYTSTTDGRHPGATKIEFGGDLTYGQRGGRCVVHSARVNLKIRLILPKWTNRKRAASDLAMIWDTLSRDIRRHEERHAEIARQHALELDRSLRSLPPARDCADLQRKVDVLSQEALVSHDADQARFDRVEAVNFEARLIRLMENRLSRARRQP